MTTTTEYTGDASVLHLTGRMTADRQDERLPRRVEGLLAGGATRLVLDLRGVSYMDSTCLGEIIEVCLTLKRRGGQLRLVNVPPQVQRLFDISRVADVLAGQPLYQNARGSAA
jgi:anti-anti-sigma factor